MNNSQKIKVIATNGQISLGKEHAGKTVLIELVKPGIWIIKVGKFNSDKKGK